MKLFIISLLAVSASAFKLREADLDGSSQIIDGTLASQGEFPYIISLKKYGGHNCGGSIYNENWVITAAHCLSVDASYYTIVAGELDFKTDSGKEQSRNVVKYILHEDWSSNTIENDIALIKVDKPFVFNDNVKSIKLNNGAAQPGDDCTVAGWGSVTGNIKSYPDDLYKVVIPIVSDETCRNAMGSYVTENNICAGDAEGGGSGCNGDSGGPLVVKDKTSNSDLLTGIVSWGNSVCGAPNKYSVFTEVQYYVNWVKKTIFANE